MKTKSFNLLTRATLALATSLILSAGPAAAQKGGLKTNSRILYHNGEVMPGHSNVYFIFYGCWEEGPPNPNCDYRGTEVETSNLLSEIVMGLSGSPYMRINTTYPDFTGVTPNGGLVLGPRAYDQYSFGASLSLADVEAIVLNMFSANQLPVDPRGIYLVLASPDVAVIDGFCARFAQYHDSVILSGTRITYGFVGNPERCPLAAAPHFMSPNGTRLPTPNDNFAADAMATWIAHVISGTVTNPSGTAWYDRYGLENSDKCQGNFGSTYTVANGAQANVLLGGRHYLIQQNWLNVGKGYCGLSYP